MELSAFLRAFYAKVPEAENRLGELAQSQHAGENHADWWERAHEANNPLWLTGSEAGEVLRRLDVEHLIRSGVHVLDIGVGFGDCARALAARGCAVHALDISQKALNRVADIATVWRAEQLDKLPGHSLDLALSHLVSQHMEDAQLTYQFRAVIRALKSNGIFAMQYCRPLSLDGHDEEASSTTAKGGGMVRTPEKIEAMARCAGARVVKSVTKESYPDYGVAWEVVHLARDNRQPFGDGSNMDESQAALEERVLAQQWFYKYTLPSGRHTETYVPERVLKVHETRLEMMNTVLSEVLGEDLKDCTALDLSSHQGFFSIELAKRVKSVVGIDMQEQHVRSSRMITDLFGLTNIDYIHGNIYDMKTLSVEPADVVVMFGLLYNLEDPIRAIRLAKSLTKKLLIIETQTTGVDLTGRIDSGQYTWQNEIMGIFGVMPGMPGVLDGSETNLMLYPSPKALVWILERIGFSEVRVVPVPEGGYEQLASGKRMMVAAIP